MWVLQIIILNNIFIFILYFYFVFFIKFLNFKFFSENNNGQLGIGKDSHIKKLQKLHWHTNIRKVFCGAYHTFILDGFFIFLFFYFFIFLFFIY